MAEFALLFRPLKRLASLAALPFALLLLAAAPAEAGEVKVAVAANFTEAAKDIGAAFEKSTGHKAVFSFGATGQLYTQISQEAPFEVFLSADQTTAKKAADDGFAVPDSRFTYATGGIVLFSKYKDLVTGEATLKDGKFTKIAIANPATAPYGAAAVEAMKALGVYEALTPKIVQGNSIAQAYQFVDTGNAELGFVALSQVIGKDEGSRWIVPAGLYTIIAQDAVLLKKGAENEAARAFLAYLKDPEAKAVKDKFGYGAGD
ncbi:MULTISPECIES: molybdate ABC transporter substrate-binding protein [Rhodomicrobium]|uniref:molybdate ABC transporter substrate-binding protein n=1 Tax=Rhodomicrobium TaxID=1068 RepID=UPI000B4BC3BF|nr:MULTISPECIES: molybdate ABC transporter substrate-binding protein [Rhodomicrobium]